MNNIIGMPTSETARRAIAKAWPEFADAFGVEDDQPEPTIGTVTDELCPGCDKPGGTVEVFGADDRRPWHSACLQAANERTR